MNEERKEKLTVEQLQEVKMTADEKAKVWNGVLRRVTDYPPGEYPFESVSNTWDGVLRRKTDFPDGAYPEHLSKKTEQ
jgi:hypothetical protein